MRTVWAEQAVRLDARSADGGELAAPRACQSAQPKSVCAPDRIRYLWRLSRRAQRIAACGRSATTVESKTWSIARLLVGRPFLRAFRAQNSLEPDRAPRAAPPGLVPDKWFVLAAMSAVVLAGMTGVTVLVSCILLGFSFDTLDPNSEKGRALIRVWGVPYGRVASLALAGRPWATPLLSLRCALRLRHRSLGLPL